MVNANLDADTTTKDVLQILSLCIIWYSLSSGSNIILKMLLEDFPYPMTVTMVQLISIWGFLIPVLRFWNIAPIDTTRTPWRYYFIMIFPLAFAKFITSVSSYVSLWKVSVSYAHTVKATMPLFTIILARILYKETQTLPVYLSVLPIIVGVCIATVTEITFDIAGLVSALISTIGFSTLNLFTKQALRETGMHHLQMLLVIHKMTFLLFFPIWMIVDLRSIFYDEVVMYKDKIGRSITLLLIDALMYSTVNVVAFTVLAWTSPLSYAVANATKRVVIIASSLILLKNPVTLTNLCGMLLAVFGVLMYNKAKLDQAIKRRRQAVLPYVQSDTNLVTHNLHLSPLQRTNTDFDLKNHFTLVPSHEDIYKSHITHSSSIEKTNLYPYNVDNDLNPLYGGNNFYSSNFR